MQTRHDKTYQSQSVKAGFQSSYGGICVWIDPNFSTNQTTVYIKRNPKEPFSSFTINVLTEIVYCNWYTERIYLFKDEVGTANDYLYVYDFDGVFVNSSQTDYAFDSIFYMDANGYHYRVLDDSGDAYIVQFNASDTVVDSLLIGINTSVYTGLGVLGFNLATGDVYWSGKFSGDSNRYDIRSNLVTGGATAIRTRSTIPSTADFIHVDYMKQKVVISDNGDVFKCDLDGSNLSEMSIQNYFLTQSCKQPTASSFSARLQTSTSRIVGINTDLDTQAITSMHYNDAGWDLSDNPNIDRIALF